MKEDTLFDRELLSISYTRLTLSSLASMLLATAISFAFFENINSIWLLIWYGLFMSISIARFISAHYFTKSEEKLSLTRWKQIFYTGTIVSSFLWGIASFIMFIPDSYLHQALLAMVIAGLCASGMSSLSSMLQATYLFLVMVLLPLALQFFMQDTVIQNYMSLVLVLFLLLLLLMAKQANNSYFQVLKSRTLYEDERKKLSRAQNRFETIFNEASVGILFYDSKLIVREVNQEFLNFLEAPREFAIGLDMNTLSDQRILSALRAPLAKSHGLYEGEYKTKYSKKESWVNLKSSPLFDSQNNVIGAVGIVLDITQRMATQKHIEYQASYDSLTNIPNRLTLLSLIKREMIRYKRHDVMFGIMFLDIDHFKNINDSLGHDMGDKLLIKIATRLKRSIRIEDTVARIGGDEFVVMLPDLSVDDKSSATILEHVAQKIHKMMEKPFEIGAQRLNISLSIGMALSLNKDKDADDILKHADIAMYQAKKDGRNTSRFYEEKMERWIQRRLGLENALRHAIKNHELEIYFQPILEIATSKLIGAEALLRWNSKEFGSVSPDEFIPIAEDSGLILSIGEWVLYHAVEQFVSWQKQFAQLVTLKKIAVNVSVHQFNNSSFLMQVERIIKNSGIKAVNLELELVESIIVEDVNIVRKKMQKLRDLGIGLSIDDFGTGYSSLSYLKKLPFTTLKIDKSFTQDIQDDVDDKELISTILTIAKNFNLEVVAEGVEASEQYAFLLQHHCTYFQGYYYSKPLTVEAFTKILTEDQGSYSLE